MYDSVFVFVQKIVSVSISDHISIPFQWRLVGDNLRPICSLR